MRMKVRNNRSGRNWSAPDEIMISLSVLKVKTFPLLDCFKTDRREL